MRYIILLLFKWLVFACLITAFPLYAEEEKTSVDLQASFDQVKKKHNQLNLKRSNIKEVNAVQQNYAELSEGIETCIATQTTQLESLKKNLEMLGEKEGVEDTEIQLQRGTFNQQIKDVDKQLKRCTLLKIQLEQMIEDTSVLKQGLLKKQFLHREFSLLTAIERLTSIDNALMSNEFEVIQPLIENIYLFGEWTLFLLVIIGAGMGGLWRYYGSHSPLQRTALTSPTLVAIMRGVRRTAFILLPLLFLLFYLYAKEGESSFITHLLQFALLLFFAFGVLRGNFFPDNVSNRINKRALKSIVFFSWLLLFAAIITYALNHEASGRFSNSILLYLMWLSSLIIAVLSFITLLWLVAHHLLARHAFSGVYLLPISLMLITAMAAFAGYRNLATLLFFGVLHSIILLIFALLLIRISSEFFDSLDEGEIFWQRKLRSTMKIDEDQLFPGVIWLRILSFFAVLFVAFIFLMLIWGSSSQQISTMILSMKNGITIGSVSLDLVKVFYGILILITMLSILPFIKNQLLLSWLKRSRLSRGAIDATQTLVGYAGIIIAIFWSLSVAGVNFKNIAIVAGALSVGIGFGLQNVVNNFVSGIILLFERPIRRGDWVVVGTTEGYVKNISIRSTTIETFGRADVIVPNSELISNQVTNWLLSSSIGRLQVPIGVAYGSDVSLVSETLEEIATQHPDVITDHPDLPIRVLFLGFGDSALNFELRCFVRDVDNRLNVLSAINHGIDREFRKANIEIPFPQHVVHVKSD